MAVFNEDLAFRVWSIERLVDWKWTPLEILAQPEALLDSVMALEQAQRAREALQENG